MFIVRFFFEKTGPASYISHLDLQRVMARALRRAQVPVWFSQGFNPHIYMTFALPLSLMQESVCEAMDCKSEAEEVEFATYIPRLNESLPAGIVMTHIALPVHKAADIEAARYVLQYDLPPKALEELAKAYGQAETVPVLHKTKRTEVTVDLKQKVPAVAVDNTGLLATLPAGSQLNYNPELLAGVLTQQFGAPAPQIVRRLSIVCSDGSLFV